MTSSTTSKSRSSGRRPQPRPRLLNIVTVRFRTNFIKHDFDARTLQLRKGDEVIVETSRGPVIARVESHIQRRLVQEDHIPRVIRRATADDLEQATRNEEREEGAYRFALERIRSRRLPMKLVRTQYVHDGSKIVFYFSADGRIDFRDLVKDLAHRFRTRIEMHQIGVRDGSRMLGGIGPCGRELCCSTFLETFAPVSIRMAKDQGLTLNPKKVSGMCGRLMCCLVYEQHVYKRMRRRLPRPGTDVYTEDGAGKVISVDIINERVTVEHEDMQRRTFPVNEVSLSKVDPMTLDADPEQEPDYLWEDLLTGLDDHESELSVALDDDPDEISSQSPPVRARRARRRSTSGTRRSESTPSAVTTDNSSSASSDHSTSSSKPDEAQRASRRSRRRGHRKSLHGETAQQLEEKSTPGSDDRSSQKKGQRRRRGRSRRAPKKSGDKDRT